LDRDQFGHDPQVRFLRRAFAGMEAAQSEFLKGLNISPFDSRLSRIRTAALKLYEKVWMVYGRRGISTDEREMVDIYIQCFAHILDSQRIPVPEELRPVNEKIGRLIMEVTK
jgi:hypothetical protein